MKQTWRYWRYVGKLAWQETKDEITKSVVRAIVAIAIVVALIHLGVVAIGFDKLVTVGAVAVVALLAFLWKMLAIPARLHRWQVTAQDQKQIAEKLEALFEDGRRLLGDSAKGSAPWADQTFLWEEQVVAALRPYSEEERLMFATITLHAPQDNPSARVERMQAKLNKLRNITSRAYRKPDGEEPGDGI